MESISLLRIVKELGIKLKEPLGKVLEAFC